MTPRRLALPAAVLVAALLRAWQLGSQIVEDDEFHGLQAAATLGAADLLARRTPHGFALDYSIPLALWNRLWIETAGLDEWALRLPVLLGGILLVPAAGLFAARRLGPAEGAAAAWLLALSPVLVLYSRFARPYGLVALLVFASLVGWLEWQRGGARRWGLGSAAAGAAAIFANPVAAPAVLAVWGLGAALALRERGPARAFAGWVAIGLGLAFLGLAPSLDSWQVFIERKAQATRPDPAAWWGAAQVLFGSRRAPAVAAAIALAAFGARIAARRAPRFAAGVAVGLLAQVAALQAVAPHGADQPMVLARYLLVAFLGVLVLVGAGLAGLAARIFPGRPLGAGALSALVLAALFAAGPLPGLYAGANSYTSHRFHYAPATWRVHPERIPAAYADLARGQGTLTEAPWTLEWDRTIYGEYQRVHGRSIRTLTTVRTFGAQGVELGTVVPLRHVPSDFSGFETLVVHKDVVGEWFHVTAQRDPQALERWTTSVHRSDAAAILEACRRSPALRASYEDEWIAVFERR